MQKPPAVSELQAGLASRDPQQLRRAAQALKSGSRFLWSAIGDSAEHAVKTATAGELRPGLASKLSAVVDARIAGLGAWSQEGNRTVAAIESGDIDADSIKPHVRAPAAEYENLYQNMDYDAAKVGREQPTDASFRPIEHGQMNVNHLFRYNLAAAAVESVISLVARRSPERAFRWIDIGCGNGVITNAVDPARCGARRWEILGVDFQPGRIAFAHARRTRGRTFRCGDAFEAIEQAHDAGLPFDIASVFEFLEHLDDPLLFLERLSALGTTYVVAASPLGQLLHRPQHANRDLEHLWSFSRRAWDQMFGLAGLTPIFAQEARVGGYIGGLDWLTTISGPRDDLAAERTDWAPLAATDAASPTAEPG